uniref:Uncharacterized protein n=1 Tax=Glossina austeni TaxID=7395 RepID=A0A1A9VI43_GLOAU
MVSLTDCEMSSLSKELFRTRGWLHLSSTLPLSRACSLFLSLYSAANRLISLKAMNVVCVLHEIVGVDFFFNALEFVVTCVEVSGDGRKLKDELDEVHCPAAVSVAGSAPVAESVLALGTPPSFPLRFEYDRWKLPKCSSDDKEDEFLTLNKIYLETIVYQFPSIVMILAIGQVYALGDFCIRIRDNRTVNNTAARWENVEEESSSSPAACLRIIVKTVSTCKLQMHFVMKLRQLKAQRNKNNVNVI